MPLRDYVTGRQNKILMGGLGVGLIISAVTYLSYVRPAFQIEEPDGDVLFTISDHGAIGVKNGSGVSFGSAGECYKSGGSSGASMTIGACGSGGGSVNTGAILNAANDRFVNVSGDTMTGALAIQNGNTHSATTTPLLNIRGTMSGRSLYITGTGSSPLFMTNITTGRIGIGTASPKAKLDVVGTISGSALTVSSITSGRVTFAGAGGSITSDSALSWDNTNKTLGVGTTASTNSYEKMLISGSDATGNGIASILQNTATTGAGNPVFAIYSMRTGTSPTADGVFFGGKSTAYSAYGIVNGITMRPGQSTQDLGLAAGSANLGTAAGPALIIKPNTRIAMGDTTGWVTSDPSYGQVEIISKATATPSLVLKGASNHATSLLEFRKYDGTYIGGMSQSGWLSLGRSAGLAKTSIDVIGTISGSSLVVNGVAGFGLSSTPQGQVDIRPASASTVGLYIKGATSQSSNFMEVRDSTNALVFSVDPSVTDMFSGTGPGLDFGSKEIKINTTAGVIDFTYTSGQGLRVIKASVFGTDDAFFQAKPGASGYAVFEGYGGAGTIVSSESGDPILFTPGRTEAARFNSAGLFGLGTTNPAVKLAASGSAVIGGGNNIAGRTAKAQFEVLGSMSGHRLVVSGNSMMSGALVVKGNITSRGTISGSTIYTANLQRPLEGCIDAYGPTTAVATGTGGSFDIPASATGSRLYLMRISHDTAGNGKTSLKVERSRPNAAATAYVLTSMLTTNISTDSGEYNSTAAATPYVVATTEAARVQGGDRIAFNVTEVPGTPPNGLRICFTFLPK